MRDQGTATTANRERRDRWIFVALMLLGFVILAARAIPILQHKGTIVLGEVQDARVERHDDTGQHVLDLKVRLDDGRVVIVTAPATTVPNIHDKVRLSETTSGGGARSYVWDGLIRQ